MIGTIDDFNTWHEIAKEGEGIPSEGRISFINGVAAPDSQRTMAYVEAVKHPEEEVYAWECMAYTNPVNDETIKTLIEIKAMGYKIDEAEGIIP